ncbi:fibronectin type III domain-containing protein [Cryobacterium frigoriphilum]|uniref:Fibronectin type III domain-containing protein n=1 Tax=Cryobacterium frigoriphilum TaxID=1259150 RepID=A0A4R9AAM5_9MICO|nr:Ig-like domain-containing protein [Cryobacterium frigoriphilum]TFD55283.1 fibronectin type III domain-containing protein [Cryobacterium frigoriphilum]
MQSSGVQSSGGATVGAWTARLNPPSFLRPSRWRKSTASVVALAVLAGVPLGFAVLHQGFPVTDVDLTSRDVWVTNGQELLAGRLNRQIEELNGSVNAASSAFDVLQHGDDVFLIDDSVGSLERIDPAFTTLGQRVDVAPGSEVVYGGDTIAVMSPAGDVWAINAAGELNFDPLTTDPIMELDEGGHIAVSATGAVFGTSVVADTLFTVAEFGGDVVEAALPDLGEHQIAAVGEQPVVLDTDANALRTVDSTIELSGTPLKLQQSGAENTFAVVATGESLLQVQLDGGGDIIEVPAEIDAAVTDPAAVSSPVWLNGCAHGAWAGAQRYISACASEVTGADPVVTVEAIEQPTLGSVLEFRVNRSVIALNNLSNGNVWLVDANMRLVENWDEVTPPEEEDSEEGDEKASQQSFEDTLAERTEQNRAPLARDDEFGVRPEKTTVLPVLSNDTDPDGDVLTVVNVNGFSEPQGKLDFIDGGRALQFTPSATVAGTVSFRYTVSDGRGAVAEANVNLTMRPLDQNQAPVATRVGAVSVEQGQLVSYNVLSDWIDPDGDDIYLVSASPTSGDGVRFGPEGFVTFESRTAELGLKEVTFVISDGLLTATGVLTVDVKAAGSLGPVGTPDFATTFVGETVLIEPLANDVSPSGAALALISVNEVPERATAVANLDRGTIAFTIGEAGSYVFTYSLGAGAASSIGLIRVDVKENPTEQLPPIAVKDTAYLRAGEPVSIPVLNNDVSPTGRVLAVQSVDTAAAGNLVSVEILTNTVLRVTASSALTQQVQFTYTISDGVGTSTAGVTVVPVPPLIKHQPPVAVDDAVNVRAGDIVSVAVMDNDYHPDSATMTLVPDLTDTSNAGGLAFVTDTEVRYQAPNNPGSYSVVYTITDAFQETATATVRFTVMAPDAAGNRAPTPVPLTMRTFADSTIRVQVPLDGIDPDGDSVYLTDVTSAPALGRIVEQGSDYFIYEAYPGTAGTDEFTYEVQDTFGATAAGTVRIGVIPRPVVLLPPIAVDDSIEMKPGRTASIPVVLNDSDPNGYALALSEQLPEVDPGITATVKGSRIIVDAPEAEGTFTLRYEITNGNGGAATAFVQINVTNDAKTLPPTAIDHIIEPTDVLGTEGQSAATVAVSVREGAENPGGLIEDLVVSLEGPNAASGAIDANGVVTVTPSNQRQAIAYRLTNELDELSATAFIIVPARPDADEAEKPEEEQAFPPPFLRAMPEQLVDMNGILGWNVADIVEVPSGRPAVLLNATATNSDGTPAASGADTLSYVAAPDYRGPASVTFLVTDGSDAADPLGNQATLTIAITVGDANFEDTAPTFTPPNVTIEAGETAVVTNLRSSSGHPNAEIVQQLSYGSLGGSSAAVAASLSAANLTISAPLGTQPGTEATLTFTVTYKEFTIPGSVQVTVVSSTRALPQAVDDCGPNCAGIETLPSQTVAISVLDNDYNPFQADGTPLAVIDAAIEQDVSGGTASVSFTSSGVSIRTGPNATGTLTAVYRVQDATKDPNREVQGRITLVIRNVPDAPNRPTATPGDTDATVTFTAPASNNSPITGYLISWNGGSQPVSGAGTHTIRNLSNGTGYAFSVTATNAIGDSAASSPSAAVTPYGVPGAPASATLSAPGQGTGALVLNWTAPTSNGGSGVTSYNYEWLQGGPAGTTSTPATSDTETGSTGTAYQYRVQACNARACGAWQSSNVATPQAIPIPPPWTPTNSATVTQRTCPEPQSTYYNPPTNDAQGCTMNPRGYLEAGTIVDAVCRSVRNGQDWFYMRIEDASYDGYFIRAAHTNRGGTSVADC